MIMKQIKTIFTGMIILVLSFTVKAQQADAVIDLGRVTEAYQKASKYSMTLEYVLFETHQSTHPFETQTADIVFFENKFLQKFGPVETYKDDKFSIMTDSEEKTFFIDQNRNPIEENMLSWNLEETLSYCDHIYSGKYQDQFRGYFLEVSLPDVEKIEIVFYKRTHFLHKIILYYRVPQKLGEESAIIDKPRMEMVYKNMNTNPDKNLLNFSWTDFMSRKEGKYVPLPKYSNYQFHDFSGGQIN